MEPVTPESLVALRWRALDIQGLERWRAIVSPGGGSFGLQSYREAVCRYESGLEVERELIDRHELLDLCAAWELDAVTPADRARLLRVKRHTKPEGRRWTWSVLIGEARGLRRSDALGDVLIGDVLDAIGLRLEAVQFWMKREEQAA